MNRENNNRFIDQIFHDIKIKKTHRGNRYISSPFISYLKKYLNENKKISDIKIFDEYNNCRGVFNKENITSLYSLNIHFLRENGFYPIPYQITIDTFINVYTKFFCEKRNDNIDKILK